MKSDIPQEMLFDRLRMNDAEDDTNSIKTTKKGKKPIDSTKFLIIIYLNVIRNSLEAEQNVHNKSVKSNFFFYISQRGGEPKRENVTVFSLAYENDQIVVPQRLDHLLQMIMDSATYKNMYQLPIWI